MSSARLEKRVGRVEVVGVARLDDHVHRFNKRGNDGTAKGNIEPSAGRRVLGVVYGIVEPQKQILDRVEGGYRQVSLRITFTDRESSTEAMGYQGVVLDPGLEPQSEYLAHYVAGAKEHGLPVSYLQEILPAWYRY